MNMVLNAPVKVVVVTVLKRDRQRLCPSRRPVRPSSATAQADILGILGRESLDLATRWGTPATGTPAYNAMKIYRNYDGNKSSFGDTSVLAGGPK